MSLWEWALVLWTVPICLAHLGMGLLVLTRRGKIPRLEDTDPKAPAQWPKVSVIIPACNEVSTLEAALETLLAQTYPNLEIVLVDDRSTDDTDVIVDLMAKRDSRILPVHIEDLPDGWLGKVHAMHCGVEKATGDWLLFSDADVHFGAGVLEKAIAHSLEEELDHVAVIPQNVTSGFWQTAMLAAFGAGLITMTKADRVGIDPDVYVGIGAFNMVRRTAFDKTEGFEWLKMEVGDDVGLAYMLNRHGAKPKLFLADQSLLSIAWYSSVGTMISGLDKNIFGVFSRYSYLRLFVQTILILIVLPAPMVALVQTFFWPLNLAGALAVISALTVYGVAGVEGRLKPLPSIMGYPALLIVLFAIYRSALSCLRQGGINWRGTFYPVALLREGQRVKL